MTTCHSLFQCAAIKHLWKNTQFASSVKTAMGDDIVAFCLWMRSQWTKGEFEEFAMIGWEIWKEKQKSIHEGSGKALPKALSWGISLLTDFQKTKKRINITKADTSKDQETNWKPPTKSMLKLNTDACVNDNLKRYSIGGVTRDQQGRLLLAFGKQILTTSIGGPW